jgi:hypothetical protein
MDNNLIPFTAIQYAVLSEAKRSSMSRQVGGEPLYRREGTCCLSRRTDPPSHSRDALVLVNIASDCIVSLWSCEAGRNAAYGSLETLRQLRSRRGRTVFDQKNRLQAGGRPSRRGVDRNFTTPSIVAGAARRPSRRGVDRHLALLKGDSRARPCRLASQEGSARLLAQPVAPKAMSQRLAPVPLARPRPTSNGSSEPEKGLAIPRPKHACRSDLRPARGISRSVQTFQEQCLDMPDPPRLEHVSDGPGVKRARSRRQPFRSLTSYILRFAASLQIFFISRALDDAQKIAQPPKMTFRNRAWATA